MDHKVKPVICYKGIRPNTVIQNNKANGGEILYMEISKQEDQTIYEICTSYADGLTQTVEKLIYQKDLLNTWTVEYPSQNKKYLIFSRDEYNCFLDQYHQSK